MAVDGPALLGAAIRAACLARAPRRTVQAIASAVTGVLVGRHVASGTSPKSIRRQQRDTEGSDCDDGPGDAELLEALRASRRARRKRKKDRRRAAKAAAPTTNPTQETSAGDVSSFGELKGGRHDVEDNAQGAAHQSHEHTQQQQQQQHVARFVGGLERAPTDDEGCSSPDEPPAKDGELSQPARSAVQALVTSTPTDPGKSPKKTILKHRKMGVSSTPSGGIDSTERPPRAQRQSGRPAPKRGHWPTGQPYGT
eukprot:CAMPEP_0172805998 /NCGR_PEP_ID=MMETSP1075-20121228/6056_1 /TAXON_ID=2916 /ORGANISM="Ceratium fusus, Strain PA161109" /LENGTH=253 /DNA_ID=CAMNT_0013644713 /DNA_START=61 /DNA_END=822 /DNA_ORIENTATION=+